MPRVWLMAWMAWCTADSSSASLRRTRLAMCNRFEGAPVALDVVELGRVSRQPERVQPGRPLLQGLGGELARVDRAVVEHQHDRHRRRSRAVERVETFEQADEIGRSIA